MTISTYCIPALGGMTSVALLPKRSDPTLKATTFVATAALLHIASRPGFASLRIAASGAFGIVCSANLPETFPKGGKVLASLTIAGTVWAALTPRGTFSRPIRYIRGFFSRCDLQNQREAVGDRHVNRRPFFRW